jgi:hypothetical protein
MLSPRRAVIDPSLTIQLSDDAFFISPQPLRQFGVSIPALALLRRFCGSLRSDWIVPIADAEGLGM